MNSMVKKTIIYSLVGILQFGTGASVLEAAALYQDNSPQRYAVSNDGRDLSEMKRIGAMLSAGGKRKNVVSRNVVNRNAVNGNGANRNGGASMTNDGASMTNDGAKKMNVMKEK